MSREAPLHRFANACVSNNEFNPAIDTPVEAQALDKFIACLDQFIRGFASDLCEADRLDLRQDCLRKLIKNLQTCTTVIKRPCAYTRRTLRNLRATLCRPRGRRKVVSVDPQVFSEQALEATKETTSWEELIDEICIFMEKQSKQSLSWYFRAWVRSHLTDEQAQQFFDISAHEWRLRKTEIRSLVRKWKDSR